MATYGIDISGENLEVATLTDFHLR
nr:hypothetical protein [Thermoplasma sp. Kam2015]